MAVFTFFRQKASRACDKSKFVFGRACTLEDLANSPFVEVQLRSGGMCNV